MSTTLQTVRIVDLSGISRDMAARIRTGQQEAAKVWMACRDELHRCMAARLKRPASRKRRVKVFRVRRKPASLEAGVSLLAKST
jgi:hypothetical protein